jgi:predicted Zn-dependent peptidase
MAIRNYVEQILSSPVYIFDAIIEKLIGKNLHFSKIELRRYSFKMDPVLLESIKLILKDLEQEEGVVSRFMYANFGFEICKNKKREQLLYLGSELKTQHKKIKSRLYSIYRQKERLAYSIVDLRRLSEGFHSKDMFFESDSVKNKNKFYIDELVRKIEELQNIQLSLLMKYDDLCEIEQIYHKLFKSIPRHDNLHEETHLLLAGLAKA